MINIQSNSYIQKLFILDPTISSKQIDSVQKYSLLWKNELIEKNKHLLLVNPLSKRQLKAIIEEHRIHIKLPWSKFIYNKSTHSKILLVENGTKHRGFSPSQIQKNTTNRGLILIEGILFAILYPNILKNHSIDLIRARYSLECIPTLYYWKGVINLSAICPDVSDSLCGAPTVLKEIILT